MQLSIFYFFLGIISLLFFEKIPPGFLIWALLITLVGITYYFKAINCLKLLLIFTLGLAWGLLHAFWVFKATLPTEIEGQSVIVEGTVTSIPEKHGKNTVFEFNVTKVLAQNYSYDKAFRVHLSWFENLAPLRVGDKWQFLVRLKKARGFWNPGSFDYQKWLFEHHIRVTGYIVKSEYNYLMATSNFLYAVEGLRQMLTERITAVLNNYPGIGLINALVTGVRDQITDSQWQVMRGTGTNHLFAIAGLHIGFVSGMFYNLISFFWRRAGQLSLYIPTPQAAAFGALVAAIFYSALAGFALPTQRAILMLTVFLITTLLRKNLPVWAAWRLALLSILLFDPLAVLSDSFWLSFGAVAFIIYGGSGRMLHHTRTKIQSIWWHWGRPQWVIAVGLIPLTLLFFHQASLASFIANAIAIPWVGFIVLPLCLLGSVVSLLVPVVGNVLLLLAEKSMELLWPILVHIAAWDIAQWCAYISNIWILLAALIAALLLLAPPGFPNRWLGFIWILPLVIWTPAAPKPGEIWFTLLDVGQGLSAIVRTEHHTLIYDTGPKYSDNFDTGNAVVVPYLQTFGIKTVDKLVISHPDNDHIGGAHSILTQLDVKSIVTSALEKLPAAKLCKAGDQWQWDGVKFMFLYPTPELTQQDNDSSCVLRVDNGKHSILLVGDIERASENFLVKKVKDLLPATIIVAPHHGSKTSSTIEFVSAVHARYALFPVGYRNRYHFPNSDVIKRYQREGGLTLSTVDEGVILFKLANNLEVEFPKTYRSESFHFWNQ